MKIICDNNIEVLEMQNILSNNCPFSNKHCEAYENSCAYCQVEQIDYIVNDKIIA